MLRPLFRNRRDAGRRLAVALAPYREKRPIVFALPRGGVPVGFEVAKALAAPLDVLLVRKIGAPGHEELGLGAVVDGHGPQLVLNEDIVRAVAPPPGYIEAEEQRQLAEIERRRQHYIGDRSPVAVEGAGRSSSSTTGLRPAPLSKRHCGAWCATARPAWSSPSLSRRPTASRSSRPNATRSCVT
jgi:hypothetical protein